MGSDQEKILEKEHSTSEQYAKRQSKWERTFIFASLIILRHFEKIKHLKMTECCKEIGLDGEHLQIIIKLFWDQTAAIRRVSGVPKEFEIKKGVRQG